MIARRRGRATPTLGGANVEQVGSLGTKMLAKMDGALTRSSASSSSSSSRRRRSPCGGRRSCARAPCRRRAPPSLTSATATAITTTARAPSSTRNKARGARLSRPRPRRHQPPRHSRSRSLVSPSRGLSRGVSDRAQSASMVNESVAPLPRHASIRPSEAFSLEARSDQRCLPACCVRCVRLEMRSCEPRRRRATSPSRPRACSRR